MPTKIEQPLDTVSWFTDADGDMLTVSIVPDKSGIIDINETQAVALDRRALIALRDMLNRAELGQ